MTHYCAYLRVSTRKQGDTGHGLDGQRATVTEYVDRKGGTLVREFQEVESGKRNDRPILREALEHCVLTGSVLIVAKLDRLSRDVSFIANLQKSGVQFVICDFPEANSFTINIFAALAQYERELIGERTRKGLEAAKKKGIRLGARNEKCKAWGASSTHAVKGRVLGGKANVAKADAFALRLKPIIETYVQHGITVPSHIAACLNTANILTARGRRAGWSPQGVKNLMDRLNIH